MVVSIVVVAVVIGETERRKNENKMNVLVFKDFWVIDLQKYVSMVFSPFLQEEWLRLKRFR